MTDTAINGVLNRLENALGQALRGRPDVVRLTAATFLAGGHLLIEDVPGMGKTTLARALASAIAGTVGRIQFTPDLMPTDLTGITVYRQETDTFTFHPGPVFANIVIADEVNRASPKTQSALLEAMQEKQVTVDGTTHALPSVFMVIATQNPIEMAGTYPLPEAQRDRFTACTLVGYPDVEDELTVLRTRGWQAEDSAPVMTVAEARDAIRRAALVHTSEAVELYTLRLVRATRVHAEVALGASPRAGLHVLALARAWALLAGRDHVLPDDIQQVLIPALAHRLLVSRSAELTGRTAADILGDLVAKVAVP